jgi:hypothetical protein
LKKDNRQSCSQANALSIVGIYPHAFALAKEHPNFLKKTAVAAGKIPNFLPTEAGILSPAP